MNPNRVGVLRVEMNKPKSSVPHPFRVFCGMGGKPRISTSFVHEETWEIWNPNPPLCIRARLVGFNPDASNQPK
jgi:hypothetical protein